MKGKKNEIRETAYCRLFTAARVGGQGGANLQFEICTLQFEMNLFEGRVGDATKRSIRRGRFPPRCSQRAALRHRGAMSCESGFETRPYRPCRPHCSFGRPRPSLSSATPSGPVFRCSNIRFVMLLILYRFRSYRRLGRATLPDPMYCFAIEPFNSPGSGSP